MRLPREMPDSVPAEGKTARTRAAVLLAARGVFESKGYEKTRVADIVQQAEVGHGTFYRYFSSKQDAFRAIALEVYEDLLHSYAVPEVEGLPPDEGLPQLQHLYLMAYRRNARFIALTEQVATIDDEVRQMRNDVRRRHCAGAVRYISGLIDQGDIDDELDVEYTAELIRAMVDRFAYTWFVLGERFDEERATAALSTAYLKLIGWTPRDSPLMHD